MYQFQKNLILLSGNEAIALGALSAGLKFYAAYPMTPVSNILHFLAAREREYKIIVKQTEDEIAAINMVIGASVAGARSMCATSGGGFALMTEGLGFGGIIETPFVVVVGMRPGPATGMPTWSAQGDLRQVMHAGQDEFPRLILAPGTMNESFTLASQSFDLADTFQIPVIILTDKFLGESQQAIESSELSIKHKNIKTLKQIDEKTLKQLSNEKHKRYLFTSDGISPRVIPGTPDHLFIANSDEHDEYGYSEEDADNRIMMMNKRMSKLLSIAKTLPGPTWYGPKEADFTLIVWGSQLGPCLEFLKILNSKFNPESFRGKIKNYLSREQFNNKTKRQFNILHFSYLYPLPITKVKKELAKIKKSICLENNYYGIFADYLFEKTGYRVDKKILKYDGRPFFADELDVSFRTQKIFLN